MQKMSSEIRNMQKMSSEDSERFENRLRRSEIQKIASENQRANLLMSDDRPTHFGVVLCILFRVVD